MVITSHLLNVVLCHDLRDGEDAVAVLVAEGGVVRLGLVLAELDHASLLEGMRIVVLVVMLMQELLRGWKGLHGDDMGTSWVSNAASPPRRSTTPKVLKKTISSKSKL